MTRPGDPATQATADPPQGPHAGTAITIVCPVHNERTALPALLARLDRCLADRAETFEVVFVDDGSDDGSAELLAASGLTAARCRLVTLARNFGKEAAISCGLDYADGDAVILLDADLQHPPELIATLLAWWYAGYDMVVPVNTRREGQTRLYRGLARGFYGLLARTASVAIPADASDFRLLDRTVVETIRRMPERTRFMKGIYAWPGFRCATFAYTPETRRHGRSKWRPWKLWTFALDGLFAFSAAPLRVWTYVGLAIALVAFGWAFKIGITALVYGIQVVPGVTTVAILVLFTLGLLMIQGGILGEYIARIFDEVKGRPLYVVRRVHDMTDHGDGRDPDQRG